MKNKKFEDDIIVKKKSKVYTSLRGTQSVTWQSPGKDEQKREE